MCFLVVFLRFLDPSFHFAVFERQNVLSGVLFHYCRRCGWFFSACSLRFFTLFAPTCQRKSNATYTLERSEASKFAGALDTKKLTVMSLLDLLNCFGHQICTRGFCLWFLRKWHLDLIPWKALQKHIQAIKSNYPQLSNEKFKIIKYLRSPFMLLAQSVCCTGSGGSSKNLYNTIRTLLVWKVESIGAEQISSKLHVSHLHPRSMASENS